MRLFKLKNNLGQIFNLTPNKNSLEDGFFVNPNGLGISYNNDFKQLGNRYIQSNRIVNCPAIEGNIIFPKKTAYENYFKFARFLDHEPLTLMYTPFSNNIFEFEVTLAEITKTELEAVGLQCNLKLQALTLPRKIIFEQSDKDLQAGKKYNYNYNYRYSEGLRNSIKVNVDTTKDCPTELIIRGFCENPEWKHYVNGNLIATGKVNATILNNNKLIVSSIFPNSILQKDLANNVTNDLYQRSVFSTQRFLFLKNGTNVITVTDEKARNLSVSLKGVIEYATV